ncbi:MAG: arsenate reductase ArsC [Rhodospirillales bacterium]
MLLTQKRVLLMKKVLVLCTGNSCRSVMAEALINHLGAGRYQAMSAGSKPIGYVHPKSMDTLRRHGIETGTPRSKSWDEFEGQNFDLVITVCDAAASESCPIFLGQHEKMHWSTPDPASVTSSQEEIAAAFDEAFNNLKTRIENELL